MCNLITTCSDTATKKILKFNKNTKTIYGAVDLKKFNSEYLSKKNKLKNSGNIIIGYSGNGRKWQGVDFLLEAFCVLKKRDPDYQLHLLLSEYVDVGSIPDVFVYKPVNHDNVAEFNGQCDILVIPRLDNIVNELSFPSKLMEYLAMGLPVVGSRTSDMHKIVKHKENGMLYKPGDINEFVGCLQELKDSNLRKKIGLNAENLVKTKYSWDTQGALFIDLIKKL
jgi:glycosyltransferase involved in cell wall biosynthesis